MPQYNEISGKVTRKVMTRHSPSRDWYLIKLNEKDEAVIPISVIRFPKKFIGKRVCLSVEFLDYKPRKRVMQDAKSQEKDT